MKTEEKIKNKNTKATYNSDITEDDISALGEKGLRADSEDDRLLLDRKESIDFQGKDLDVPGRHQSNLNTKKSITDEENTLFAQGGEDNENLEAPERANTSK
ncbi:hypothetical protein M4I21_10675 [Cellulophaga sp. 20_2_10]|uniref:hypothetical protein n=1 Tax=Cellulophaga sp. 20_2_10 TaxID=2942476 RepID=UPI00201A5CE3|nr:hypothetical protein [Cellulophaga sp. 20_2_10]MCL5246274.1 hypothetical protein [Cellulophaga sp. 20_2_10]